MESNQQKFENIEASIDIMTVHDLAIYLKMSDANIYRMARAGSLPVIRIGKTWRFKKEMIDAWLMKHTNVEFESN
jgi:excisionase family DNA binding protein